MPDEIQKESKKNNQSFIRAVGRRKEAAARVRLYKGKGQITVNDKPVTDYFPLETEKTAYLKPFLLTKSEGEYWATIKVKGSGRSGQLQAVVHGLARALDKANGDFHTLLKRGGLLTRDPRVKERRKYGLAQKARKGKQSPKR